MTVPQSSTADSLKQSQDPAGGVILLPQAQQPVTAATSDSRRGQYMLDCVLTFLVLALAFLVASFLARNTDLWFHLATGRLLANGQFAFGADPFAYTTAQVYWACHSWLCDLGLYALYGLAGGAGLVVVKALLITALAALLMQVRRPADAAWLPAVCTTLAVLAMSPRLLLQPACVSYFLLGLTFWLLWRPHAEAEQRRETGDEAAKRTLHPSWFILPVVFALWVNVDDWFFLGPLLTGLFWFGERLKGPRRTPGWLAPAGLAACLLNPYTFHAFTLPPELSSIPWTTGLRQDVRFQAQFASPWQPAYLHAAARLDAAALAYYLLTALGLFSFLTHREALRGWRLAVWLPFAVLAAWQARAIPFFVIVAAPITSLNWQDFLAGRRSVAGSQSPVSQSGTRKRAASGALSGRLFLVLAVLALIFLAWPGWLAGYGREGRHVAWGIQTEPSLQRATEALHDWRQHGLLLPGERVLALSPEVAQVGAWFCPGEKDFFDHRYSLFPVAGRDYETVCRALLPEIVPSSQQDYRKRSDEKTWQQVLRDHGVGIVIVHEPESSRLFAVLRRLGRDAEHWTLLHVAGQTLIFGWNQDRPAGAFAPLAFDADRLVFGPQNEAAQRELPAVPEQGPEQLTPRRDLWARLNHPPAVPGWESTAASVYMHTFDDHEASERQQQLQASLSCYAAGLAGLPALPSATPQAAMQLFSSRNLLLLRGGSPSFLVRDQLGPFFGPLVERSPALPMLAVRAARRALADNPQDSNAWLRLGQAYLLLRSVTCERSNEGLLPPLLQLRQVQIVTALEQALQLNPDLVAAHHELAYLYGERHFLDRSLEHRRQELRLSRSAPRASETAEEAADRLNLLKRDTAQLEELVEKQRKTYAAGSRTLQGERLAEAGMALKLGLARQAAEDILLPAPAALLGAPGMKLELELLLLLGRAEDVRAILSDERLRASKQGLLYYDLPAPPNLNGRALSAIPYHWPAYDWLRVLQAAALGDYAEAQQSLRTIRAGLHDGHDRMQQQVRNLERGERLLLPGLLSGPPPFLPAFTAQALNRVLEQKSLLESGEVILRTQQADLRVLEGLLAMEQGDAIAARSAFGGAQKLCRDHWDAEIPFAGGPIAAGYLRKLNGYE